MLLKKHMVVTPSFHRARYQGSRRLKMRLAGRTLGRPSRGPGDALAPLPALVPSATTWTFTSQASRVTNPLDGTATAVASCRLASPCCACPLHGMAWAYSANNALRAAADHRRRGSHSDLRGMNSTPTVEYCLQDIYRIL
jgi:hypothetical protein